MNRYRPYLIALALFALLALVMTWPLAAHLGTHVPGSASWAFDESTFLWNTWWFKFSVLDLGQSPLHSDYIFYPLGVDLVTYTFNFFNAALGLPLQLAGLSIPLVSNLALLFAFVSSGFGAYLLALDLLPGEKAFTTEAQRPQRKGTKRFSSLWPLCLCGEAVFSTHLAAFIAGAVYAFAASRLIYAALGHYNFVTTQAFPFYTLFLLRTLRRPGLRNPVLAGLFAAFGILAEMTFGVLLLFLTAIVWLADLTPLPPFPGKEGGSRLSPLPSQGRGVGGLGPPWAGGLGLPVRLAVLGLTAAIACAPVLAPVLQAYRAGGFELAGWGEGLKLSADVVGWFTPTALHPLFGAADWPAHLRAVVEGKGPFGDVNTVFLGFGVLALAILGIAAAGRRVRAWTWAAIAFAVLTLGPLLQVGGRYLFPLDNLLREQGLAQDVTVPLPFALLHYLPLVKANRVPNRFSIPLTLALAVLAAFGAAWLLRRLRGRGRRAALAAVLVAVALFDQASMPLPLTDARIPAPYAVVAAEPGDFAVLQIPLGWRNSFGTRGAERTQLEYYQSYHHKRMLAGNTSRNPAFKFDYFTRIPLIRALIEREMYNEPDEETLARARAQAGELLALYDIRYLIVHDPLPYRFPEVDTTAPTRDLALSLLPTDPEPVAQGDGAAVYRLRVPPLPDPLRVDLGEWRAWPYRGEGWEADEDVFGVTANWALGTRAELLFPVRDAGAPPEALQVRIAPFEYAGGPRQTVTAELNGRATGGPFELAGGWQTVEIPLPAGGLRAGVNTLALRFDHAVAPAEALPDNTDPRPLAAAVDWFELR